MMVSHNSFSISLATGDLLIGQVYKYASFSEGK